ncbi:MAG: hypothetical protein H0W45_08920 [Acidobacteria bacterium]|nr:hypothetical protein [Acidobacteriota bacterium]
MFNRTNLQGINNVVGNTTVGTTGVTSSGLTADQVNLLLTTQARGIRGKAPTQPLGFTSAGAPRQFQFGARFGF